MELISDILNLAFEVTSKITHTNEHTPVYLMHYNDIIRSLIGTLIEGQEGLSSCSKPLRPKLP